MSFVIDNEQCIDCRLCIPECLDGGISVDFGSAGEFGNTGTYVIDSNKITNIKNVSLIYDTFLRFILTTIFYLLNIY